jgi:hypothetical protein
MKFLGPGKALAASREPVLPTDESTNIWPDLIRIVAENESALEQVRQALAVPDFAFNLDYRQMASLLIPHLARVKGIAQWLSTAVMVNLHEGWLTNACDNLLALAALASKNQHESLMISELVRVAITAIALNTTWEALQCSGWTDEQLRDLQSAWQSVDFWSQAEAALAMERPFGEHGYAAGRQSYAAINFTGGSTSSGLSELTQMGKEVLDNPTQGFRSFLHRYPGYWGWKFWQSYDDELESFEAVQAGLEAIRLTKKENVAGFVLVEFEQRAARMREARPRTGRWFSQAMPEILQRFLFRIRGVEIQRSLVVAAIALERYKLKHSAYPAEFSALWPEFAAGPFRDPIDGKPLHYRLNPDGSFVLYSVGENGVDDGGNPEPQEGAPRQWWRARDAVWPRPATTDEIRADFERTLVQFQKNQTEQNRRDSVIEQYQKRYGLLPKTPVLTNVSTNR